MDVVYNHTSGTGDASLYDLTVPGYFYRLNPDGTYSNGSGCGSEVATEHKMVRKFVVDSVKHWMLILYYIDNFINDLRSRNIKMYCFIGDTLVIYLSNKKYVESRRPLLT